MAWHEHPERDNTVRGVSLFLPMKFKARSLEDLLTLYQKQEYESAKRQAAMKTQQEMVEFFTLKGYNSVEAVNIVDMLQGKITLQGHLVLMQQRREAASRNRLHAQKTEEKIARSLDLTYTECCQLIQRYREAYPQIDAWYRSTLKSETNDKGE